MIRIRKGEYFTVEQFRQKCGYSTSQPIYRAIKLNRIDGVIRVGNAYLIPSGSVIVDKRIKTGNHIGVSALVRGNKESKK